MAIEWGRFRVDPTFTHIFETTSQFGQFLLSLSSAMSNLLLRRFESEIGDSGRWLFESPRSGVYLGMVVSMLDGGHVDSIFLQYGMLMAFFWSLRNHQPDLPQDSWNIHFTPVRLKKNILTWGSPQKIIMLQCFILALLDSCKCAMPCQHISMISVTCSYIKLYLLWCLFNPVASWNIMDWGSGRPLL